MGLLLKPNISPSLLNIVARGQPPYPGIFVMYSFIKIPRIMKLHHLFTAGMFAACFMTSCTEDAFVDNVLPEPITQEHEFNTRSAGVINLHTSQRVALQAPPCNDGLSAQAEPEGPTDNPNKEQPCYGAYGLAASNGTGFDPELGNYHTDFAMEYDPETEMIDGLMTLTAENGDILTLKAIGQAWKMETIEGTELITTVVYSKGTGQFANRSFKGDLKVMQIDQIFDRDHAEYPVTVIVTGSLSR